jgi:streptogramin lyase
LYDGLGTAAALFGPTGLAPDASGNVYVMDYLNNALRIVSASTGAVTTVAGGGSASGTLWGFMDGTGPNALISTSALNGIAADCAGSVFVADAGNNAIRRVAVATGTVVTVAGRGSRLAGVGTNARFSSPYAVVVVGDSVYVADTGFNLIRRVIVGSGAADDDRARRRLERSHFSSRGSAAACLPARGSGCRPRGRPSPCARR